MLKKKLRLKNPLQYKTILSKGKSFPAKHFKAYSLESQEPQFGVITSKKFSKKAVERNMARRAIYRALAQTDLSLEELFREIVFIPKRSILSASNNDINEDIEKYLTNLKQHESHSDQTS